MSRLVLYPYKLGSESAKKLAEALDIKRVRPDGRYRYRRGDKIINWGNSTIPVWFNQDAFENMLNAPVAVGRASNKIETFKALTEAEVPTLDWSTDSYEAQRWLNDGAGVYIRQVVTGHSGEGITVMRNYGSDYQDSLMEMYHKLSEMGYDAIADEVLKEADDSVERQLVPQAPLYTKAKENHGEYRVHVFQGKIIDYRKKSRRDGDPAQEGQSDVRTLGNGWVFRQSNLKRLERIEELAIRAIEALSLDFGAVDIIKDQDGEVFVVEVNTAVSCDDETLSNYLTAINDYYATT